MSAQEALAAARAAVEQVNNEDEARAVILMLRQRAQEQRARTWTSYEWQRPHVHPEGWVSERWPGRNVCDDRCIDLPTAVPPVHGLWLQRGGRGTGKTEGAAHYVDEHVRGPACDPRVPGGHRLTIAAPTQTDAVSSCVMGVSGLKAINPLVSITTNREGTTVRWPSGAVARLLGAHSSADVDRARAWSNVCLWWVEEAAAMPRLGGLAGTSGYTGPEGMLDQAPFTLRLHAEGSQAPPPHMVVTTTPKNRPEVIHLLNRGDVVETWGRTRDAHRLDPLVRDALEVTFGGSTAGRQELDGDLIADVPGALWVRHRPETVDGQPNDDERPGIENDRIKGDDQLLYGWRSHTDDLTHTRLGVAPEGSRVQLMERVIIGVDPPGGRTECGITVHGTIGRTGYLLADLSLAGPPNTWARIVLEAWRDYGAEGIAAEHTYGGDMVTAVIMGLAEQMLDDGELPSIPAIFRVPTKVGKRLRAEPVQALAQQHRIHHIGYHEGVEAEQCTWVPGETKDSPNRIDAYVHGFTYLLIRNRPGRVANPARSQRRLPSTLSPRR